MAGYRAQSSIWWWRVTTSRNRWLNISFHTTYSGMMCKFRSSTKGGLTGLMTSCWLDAFKSLQEGVTATSSALECFCNTLQISCPAHHNSDLLVRTNSSPVPQDAVPNVQAQSATSALSTGLVLQAESSDSLSTQRSRHRYRNRIQHGQCMRIIASVVHDQLAAHWAVKNVG